MNNFLNIENRTKYFAWVLLVLAISSIGLFSALVKQEERRIHAEETQNKPNAFANISIAAKSAIVWDVVEGKALYEKNADESLPLASLTKVMTALTVSKMLKGSSNIKIDQSFLAPEGDSGLKVGDSWTAKDLLDYTLITSSNDGAYALASVAQAAKIMDGGVANPQSDEAFIRAMNDTAREVGLQNSRFWNEHGLDRNADRGGAYGSARDMAKLVEYILKKQPDLLEATRYKSLAINSTEARYEATNTNQFVDSIPGILASKTGYTDLAGGNLVIAYDAGLGRPIVITVLGSTQEGRFDDTLKLVNASLEDITLEK